MGYLTTKAVRADTFGGFNPPMDVQDILLLKLILLELVLLELVLFEHVPHIDR